MNYKRLLKSKVKTPLEIKIWKFYNMLNIVGIVFFLLFFIFLTDLQIFERIETALAKPIWVGWITLSLILSIFIIYGIQKRFRIGLHLSYVFLAQEFIFISFELYNDFTYIRLSFLVLTIFLMYFVIKERQYFKSENRQ